VNQRQCFLGNRAALDVRERQAQHDAAPALDQPVEDLLVAVLQRSDERVVAAIELTAARRVRGTCAHRDYFVALARPPLDLFTSDLA
jgi:hypothetical protein